jgi:hypothetical protein
MAARDELARRFPSVSATGLRRILRASGISLHPMVEGVRQDTFESLERTLISLRSEYLDRKRRGERREAQPCRNVVIEARRHTELALRNRRTGDQKRREKTEMLLWIRTWLENPDAFPVWLLLRKRRLALENQFPPTEKANPADS